MPIVNCDGCGVDILAPEPKPGVEFDEDPEHYCEACATPGVAHFDDDRGREESEVEHYTKLKCCIEQEGETDVS